MKDEYIIINKTAIQKRIEELEKQKIGLSPNLDISEYYDIEDKVNLIKEILSQSTPLIPEIEKAFDAGRKLSHRSQLYVPDFYWTKEDYISNLKLDI